jgi:hypothetical protein
VGEFIYGKGSYRLDLVHFDALSLRDHSEQCADAEIFRDDKCHLLIPCIQLNSQFNIYRL